MSTTPANAEGGSHYKVKSVRPVMAGGDMQARLFVLAPGDTIPWHHHTRSRDHYFVLEGIMTALTRHPEVVHAVAAGNDYVIPPGTAHQITNRTGADCRFLLLQGAGTVDWVRETD
jgi:mannose-6-phosphate isomerase-like protein (cupin superfamily)